MTRVGALREKHRSETRELILTAAREAFVREGHARLTMRDLALRLGCSPGAIYLHFTSKEELLRRLVEESFAKLLEVLNGVPVADDPLDGLKARLRAYVDFGLVYPYHYHFAFLLPATGGRRRRGSSLTPHEAFDVLRRSVAECRMRGVMRRVDGETASQALWAAVHGITSLLIAKPDFPWVEREKLIGGVIDMAVAGLMKGRPDAGRGGERHARDRGKGGGATGGYRGDR